MVVKLEPDQIAEYWDMLKVAILGALPPTVSNNGDLANNILENMLAGGLDCWVVYNDRSGIKKISLIATTTISDDLCSRTRNLLVYTVFGVTPATGKEWQEGFETLAKYGRSKGCSKIIAYTDVESIKKIARILGGDTRYTFISIPIS